MANLSPVSVVHEKVQIVMTIENGQVSDNSTCSGGNQ